MKKVFKDAQLQALLEENGYVQLPMLDETELEDLQNFYRGTNFQIPENDFFSTMHINDPAYRKVVDDHIKRIMKPHVEQLLIDHEILFANYLYKKPSSNSLVGIHQDWTYIDEDEHQSVNIWIPMINTNEVNGGLAVLKKSHKLKTPVRYTPFEDPAFKESLGLIEKRSVAQPVKRGEAFIYYSNLIHYSTPNNSDRDRLSINMVVIPKGAQPIHFHKNNGNIEKYFVDSSFYNNYKLFEQPQGYDKDPSFRYSGQCFTQEELMDL